MFVWGETGKNYSKEVIRSYICKHGSILQRRRGMRLTIAGLAAIHAGGSSFTRKNVLFGSRVAQLVASKLNLVYMILSDQIKYVTEFCKTYHQHTSKIIIISNFVAMLL